MKHSDLIECAGCGRTAKHRSRRLCQSCWRLHRSTGTLHWFPSVATLNRLARRENYVELLAQNETREQAAKRAGVSLRTAERYEAQLRQEASA